MTPSLLYSGPGVELWHGDCRDAAAVVGASLFSLVLADPPYTQTRGPWDRWPTGWLGVMRPLLLPEGSMWSWGTLAVFMRHAQEFFTAGWALSQDCIWEKHNGSGNPNARFLRVHEQVGHFIHHGRERLVYRKPQKVPAPPEVAHKRGRVINRKAQSKHRGKQNPSTYFDCGWRWQRSVWKARSMHRLGAEVETPKPLEVLEPCVRYSSAPGGRVLVPFCGSGQEVIACLKNGRTVVAFDIRASALHTAARRIEEAMPGLKLAKGTEGREQLALGTG